MVCDGTWYTSRVKFTDKTSIPWTQGSQIYYSDQKMIFGRNDI